MKASHVEHVILVSYPVFFVHVFIIDCCIAIFMRNFVVQPLLRTAILLCSKYFDFVVSDDIFVDSRLLLSTLDFLLSTLDFLLSTLDFYSRLLYRLSNLLSTLDLYSLPSTFRYTHRKSVFLLYSLRSPEGKTFSFYIRYINYTHNV